MAVPHATPGPLPERLRVLFLIRDIAVGGAERQLALLARGLPRDRFDVTVATLYDSAGPIYDDLAAAPHVRVVSLGKARRWDVAGFFARLARLARDVRPHLVHGYMIPANELSLFAGRVAGARVAWGVRISDQDPMAYTRFRRTVHRVGVRLSRFPDLLIANSFAGRASHVAEGYPRGSFIVIPNGVDVERFRPDADAGRRWRASLGIAADDLVVALPARLDPMKGHPIFLDAAARVLAATSGPALRIVCAGDGTDAYRGAMRAVAADHGIDDRVTWTPSVRDVVGLYNGADVVASASVFGEGFPNVLGEAMACGTPCVAAASGDAAIIVGDAGTIVPPRDPAALADGLLRTLALDAAARAALGARARARIAAEFTIARLVERSGRAFEAVVAGRTVEGLEEPPV
ncbi:glycosyl transferase [Gemmatimonadetes bacterium T265]|nr:glycosyl transferase [Gemmatimonadetes bacterium T265]